MAEKKTYAIRITRSDELNLVVKADSEEEAESIVDRYADRKMLDGIVTGREPEYGRAFCVAEIDAVVNEKEG